MKKIIYFIVLCVIIACDPKTENLHRQEIDSMEALSAFVLKSQPIRDSIKKIKTYDAGLIICHLEKTETHNIVGLHYTCVPFYIDRDYVYKSIDGVDIIFLDYKKPLVRKNIPPGLKSLIDRNIVKFETSDMLCCQMPFFKFAFCNADPRKMSCYDSEIEGKRTYEYIKGGPVFSEDMLYPKCD